MVLFRGRSSVAESRSFKPNVDGFDSLRPHWAVVLVAPARLISSPPGFNSQQPDQASEVLRFACLALNQFGQGSNPCGGTNADVA